GKVQKRRPFPLSIAFENRPDLDLRELLDDFRSFLFLVEEHAPEPLGEAARRLRGAGPENWTAQLDAFWHADGREDPNLPESDTKAKFFPRAFLQPYAESLAGALTMPPLAGTNHFCPLCGSRPLLGVLRPEGDGAKRFLLCSFCSREWEFRRILCAACGEED